MTMENEFFRMTGICKSYRMGDEWQPVLKNVDLSIEKGEFLSILGPSGSGKSTLMNMLSGIYFPDEGQIFIDGEEVTAEDIAKATGTINYEIVCAFGQRLPKVYVY